MKSAKPTIVSSVKEEPELTHSKVTKKSYQLTEFGKELWLIMKEEGSPVGDWKNFCEEDIVAWNDYSDRLLTIARKQFIEEAYKYLDANLYDKVCYDNIRPDIVSHFIEEFRKALEKGV